jgi:hypothetical protein
MPEKSDVVKKQIETLRKLAELSDEELRARLDKHVPGDIADLLLYSGMFDVKKDVPNKEDLRDVWYVEYKKPFYNRRNPFDDNMPPAANMRTPDGYDIESMLIYEHPSIWEKKNYPVINWNQLTEEGIRIHKELYG